MGEFQSAAVIGAGVMGAGIAAQLADAGLQVSLLDLDPALAAAGVARQLKAGGFIDLARAETVRVGSSLTDLDLVADVDWIIESAAELLEVKRRIFDALNAVRKPGSIVSSNTSTILLSKLTEGMAPRFAADLMITHFFNPPRWMRLMELVAGPATRPDAVAQVADFAERRLGKSVVTAKDTPGFIANRIGNYWMAVAIDEAVAQRLDIEAADAVIGALFGVNAGIFGLLDLVGIDLLPIAFRSLQSALPPDDPLQAFAAEPPLIARLIGEGRIGRKAGAGFTRRLADGSFEVLDLATGDYRPRRAAPEVSGEPGVLISDDTPAGRFARGVLDRTLAYAAALVPEIADTPDQVDRAMRDGYGWKRGPFELIAAHPQGARWRR